MDRTNTETGGGKPRVGKRVKRRPKRLQVYQSWCKRCGICVAFCPKGALQKDPQGYPVWKDTSSCVACRMCELRCPDFAIEVITEEVSSHEDEG
jgi:2-oxoglutarate ferredoxin oxidoreductase subunit delta